jgi:glycosyltransferase involved in cell wall biosynthesis
MNEELKKKCKFFIIGESNEGTKISLVNLIKNLQLDNNFIFTGYINENSQTIISNLDLLVSLTRSFEGFGLSLAEALSIGTPVLATNVGAIKEYLTEEMADLLQASDIISIRNKLENFIENKEEWKKKATINKEIFLKKNNSELMSLKYFNHLTQQFNLV